MFCYAALHFGDIDLPQKIPGDHCGSANGKKWVFCLMRNAQSE